MQVKLAETRSRTYRKTNMENLQTDNSEWENLLCSLWLDLLVVVVSFFLAAREDVLSALVNLGGFLELDAIVDWGRRLIHVLLSRSKLLNLCFLGTGETKQSQCVRIRTQKPANMPAKTPAHTHSYLLASASLASHRSISALRFFMWDF